MKNPDLIGAGPPYPLIFQIMYYLGWVRWRKMEESQVADGVVDEVPCDAQGLVSGHCQAGSEYLGTRILNILVTVGIRSHLPGFHEII